MGDPDTTLYSRSEDVIESNVGGDTVLLDTVKWDIVEFDKTGATIWALLKEPRSLPSIVDELLTRFDVSAPRCLEETRAFLDTLGEQGLVRISKA